MNGQMVTLSDADMLAALHASLAEPTRHLVLARPLDDEEVANEMRLEQAAEAAKDDRAWGRNVHTEWAGESR